jgi:hypothetical protein
MVGPTSAAWHAHAAASCRHMFPLSLCVARLSGVGTDTLFIGVMRHEPTATTADHQIVKVSCRTEQTCQLWNAGSLKLFAARLFTGKAG